MVHGWGYSESGGEGGLADFPFVSLSATANRYTQTVEGTRFMEGRSVSKTHLTVTVAAAVGFLASAALVALIFVSATTT